MDPKYLDCKGNTRQCKTYMKKECKETCPWAEEVGGYGIGACCDAGVIGRLEEKIEDK